MLYVLKLHFHVYFKGLGVILTGEESAQLGQVGFSKNGQKLFMTKSTFTVFEGISSKLHTHDHHQDYWSNGLG